jgi:hypothetical protein
VKSRRAGFVLALALLAVGAGGASASSSDLWQKLRRPLHLPDVATGAHCPVSSFDRRLDFRRYGVGAGLGRGPAYPIYGSATMTVEFPPTGQWSGSAWGGAKVLWFVRPVYRGPVLIRGRRLDGSAWARFDGGKVPASELRIPTGSSAVGNPGVKDVGQRYRPSYTRVRAPGCYAYQIDGSTFSRVVVFRVVREQGTEPVPEDDWAKLRRPLDLPTIGAGVPCPVSPIDERFDFGRYGVAPGIGPGPAWPVGLAQPGSVLRFTYPPPPGSLMYGSEWSGNKVLWFVSPAVVGPVLVRGRRIDGPGEVRFDLDKNPSPELRLPTTLGHPSTTRIRAAGCYAYQVDGPSFSYPIVFRAELAT